MFRNSPPEVFSKKAALQTQTKPTGEQLCRSLLCNFIEIIPTHRCAPKDLQHTRRTPLSRRTPLGDCFCMSKMF